MPTDETRRLLRTFGVAVTTYEDLIENRASGEEIQKAEAEVLGRLEEVRKLHRSASHRDPSIALNPLSEIWSSVKRSA